MKIQIQYFSALRDLNAPEVLDLPEGSSVQQLLDHLFAQAPGLSAWDKYLIVAAGVEYVTREYLLRPSETISLMPPVQGG